MRRWHEEVAFMERQRQEDLREHRSSALRRGLCQDDFECECKVSRGIFRKHKQRACSCHICRYETNLRKLGAFPLRRRDKRLLITSKEFIAERGGDAAG